MVNLSELVIALRPEVQPGDDLQLKIVREGKEAEQGVGYLEDGTMVVVEDARRRIGERLGRDRHRSAADPHRPHGLRPLRPAGRETRRRGRNAPSGRRLG